MSKMMSKDEEDMLKSWVMHNVCVFLLQKNLWGFKDNSSQKNTKQIHNILPTHSTQP